MSDESLRRFPLSGLNAHLTCFLCKGYLVDATTIIECLHSFCKSCIVRYLDTSSFCPCCDVQVHKTKPLVSLREDRTLQDIVYKLVPGLFSTERKRRTNFYEDHPHAVGDRTEQSLKEKRYFFHVDDLISLSLEYLPPAHAHAAALGLRPIKAHHATRDYVKGECDKKDPDHKSSHKRYMKCRAAITINLLEKFLRKKYSLSMHHKIDVMYAGDCLSPDLTLLDVVYMYKWNEDSPLKFLYTVLSPPSVRARRRGRTSSVMKPFRVTEKSSSSPLKQSSPIKLPPLLPSSPLINGKRKTPPLSPCDKMAKKRSKTDLEASEMTAVTVKTEASPVIDSNAMEHNGDSFDSRDDGEGRMVIDESPRSDDETEKSPSQRTKSPLTSSPPLSPEIPLSTSSPKLILNGESLLPDFTKTIKTEKRDESPANRTTTAPPVVTAAPGVPMVRIPRPIPPLAPVTSKASVSSPRAITSVATSFSSANVSLSCSLNSTATRAVISKTSAAAATVLASPSTQSYVVSSSQNRASLSGLTVPPLKILKSPPSCGLVVSSAPKTPISATPPSIVSSMASPLTKKTLDTMSSPLSPFNQSPISQFMQMGTDPTSALAAVLRAQRDQIIQKTVLQQMQEKQEQQKQSTLQQLYLAATAKQQAAAVAAAQQQHQHQQQSLAVAAAAAAAAASNASSRMGNIAPSAASRPVTSTAMSPSSRAQFTNGFPYGQRPPFINPTKPRLGRPPNPNKGLIKGRGGSAGRGSRGGRGGKRGGGIASLPMGVRPNQQSAQQYAAMTNPSHNAMMSNYPLANYMAGMLKVMQQEAPKAMDFTAVSPTNNPLMVNRMPASPAYNPISSTSQFTSSNLMASTAVSSSPVRTSSSPTEAPVVPSSSVNGNAATAPRTAASNTQTAPSPRPAKSPAPSSPSTPNSINSPTPEVTITKLSTVSSNSNSSKSSSTNTISITKRSSISISSTEGKSKSSKSKGVTLSPKVQPNHNNNNNGHMKPSPLKLEMKLSANSFISSPQSNGGAKENAPISDSGPLPKTSSILQIEHLTKALPPSAIQHITSVASNGSSKY